MEKSKHEQTEILIVDDKPENLKVLIQILEEEQFKVLIATGGVRALSQIGRRKPDLILLDIMMPEMDGFETCEALKGKPELADIPVIFITALSDTESIVKAFEVGGIDYISKPFIQEEVLARIRTHLTISAQQNMLAEKNKQLVESNTQFLDLFEFNPVSLWEEDFSELIELLEDKKKDYKNNIKKYLDENPEFVQECAKKIKVVNINKASVELHGFENKYELSKKIDSTFTKKSIETFKRELICIVDGKKSFKEETELQKADGSIIYVVLQMFVPDNSNKVIISITDITAQKKATIKLEEQSMFINTLLNNLEVGVVACNKDGNLSYFNKTTEDFHGLPQKEIPSEDWANYYDLYLPDGKTKMVKEDIPLYKALRGEQFNDIEMMIIPKQGNSLKLLSGGRPLFDSKGQIQGAVVVMYDITERQKHLEEIDKQAKFMDVLFKNSLDSMAILDKDYNFVKVSEAYAKATQREASSFIGKNHFELYPSDFKNDADLVKKNKSIYYNEARPFTYPDHPEWGVTYWNLGFVPVLDNKNEIELFILTLKDVTEQTKAKQELNKQNQEYASLNEELTAAKLKAEESDQLKTEFLNNMSHEIRTPMNGILGFANMLNKPGKSEQKKKLYIDIIQNSGKQLMRIIDDILEISVLGTKQVSVLNEEACLNDLLLEQFSIFDVKAKENKTPLYLKKGLSDKESIIFTDKSKLHKILSNLLENALKFTHKGFIEFGYTLHEKKIQIYVKDTGIGIAPDNQQIIFKRFSQEEKDLNKNVGGLGLGLSIAKENTELLGGTITLESEKGKGSTFFVTIPYKPVSSEFETNKQKNTPESSIHTKTEKYTFLIVEDEEVNHLYLQVLLEDEIDLNCTTLHAKNGQEAVDMCKTNMEISFVLMDLKMPVMNGFEASKIIKSFRPDLPIVAQTAYSTKVDRDKALKAGCDEFISKPISEDIINEMIQNYLVEK